MDPVSNSNGQVFLRDLQGQTTTLISKNIDGTTGSNLGALIPQISADGRYVAFVSKSSDLTPEFTGGGFNLFIKDRQTGIVTLASPALTPLVGADVGIFDFKLSADGQSPCS